MSCEFTYRCVQRIDRFTMAPCLTLSVSILVQGRVSVLNFHLVKSTPLPPYEQNLGCNFVNRGSLK